jgi:hypothetical protein
MQGVCQPVVCAFQLAERQTEHRHALSTPGLSKVQATHMVRLEATACVYDGNGKADAQKVGHSGS